MHSVSTTCTQCCQSVFVFILLNLIFIIAIPNVNRCRTVSSGTDSSAGGTSLGRRAWRSDLTRFGLFFYMQVYKCPPIRILCRHPYFFFELPSFVHDPDGWSGNVGLAFPIERRHWPTCTGPVEGGIGLANRIEFAKALGILLPRSRQGKGRQAVTKQGPKMASTKRRP